MWFTLTPAERAHLHEQLRGVADDPRALDMRQFIQHGCVTTYEHCLRVTTLAYWLNLRLHCHARERSLLRGAFLHDFYLYDWHRCREAVLVCIADKLAALWETVARRAPA